MRVFLKCFDDCKSLRCHWKRKNEISVSSFWDDLRNYTSYKSEWIWTKKAKKQLGWSVAFQLIHQAISKSEYHEKQSRHIFFCSIFAYFRLSPNRKRKGKSRSRRRLQNRSLQVLEQLFSIFPPRLREAIAKARWPTILAIHAKHKRPVSRERTKRVSSMSVRTTPIARQNGEPRGIPDEVQSRWPRKRRYGSLNWNLLEQPRATRSVQRTSFISFEFSLSLSTYLSMYFEIHLSRSSLKFGKKCRKKRSSIRLVIIRFLDRRKLLIQFRFLWM